MSDKVNGKVTVDLHDVSWGEALDSILQMQGLIKHETDNVIMFLLLMK
ncbi:MAG: STN domain-containing protein [Coxiellaceae bacterium]|nr:STN domain-containing protein [Coxiellaceae bacterium]